MLAILFHGGGNLNSEFACRRKHEGLRQSLMYVIVKNGECEGGGFASACLGLTDHIHACEHEGDHAFLNSSWRYIAKFDDGLLQLWAQV